jgi:hypothetical protein
MGTPAVTWRADRGKSWIGRPPRREAPPKPEPPPSPPILADTDGVIVVPIFPSFSLAAIADLLSRFGPHVSRQTVRYWTQNGKMDFYRDNLEEPYVLREELIRFIKEYLKREVKF